jgi:hypothetical protein
MKKGTGIGLIWLIIVVIVVGFWVFFFKSSGATSFETFSFTTLPSRALRHSVHPPLERQTEPWSKVCSVNNVWCVSYLFLLRAGFTGLVSRDQRPRR